MNLRIDVPADIEKLLKAKAAEAGVAVEAFVLAAVNDRLASSENVDAAALSAEQFSNWLVEWSKKFPVLEHPVDDSRESIYAGRGD